MKAAKRVLEILALIILVGLIAAVLLPALSTATYRGRQAQLAVAFKESLDRVEDRMLTWSAELGIEVDDVSEAASAVARSVQKRGGYILSRNEHSEKWAHLSVRIPAVHLTNALDEVSTLGKVTRRVISCADVTEPFIDSDAKLKNNRALRDRLRQLLDKAKDVKDILEIEKELTRIQSEIDSLEGRLKKLQTDVEYAAV